MKTNNPVVIIPDHNNEDGRYVYRNKKWTMSTLRMASKHLEVFDLQLAALDLSGTSWDVKNIADYLHHHKRVVNADLKYPVILDPEGYIIDGWHRVCKGIIEGRPTIKAVRLEIMPEEDTQVAEE